jgi:hypothetical protein
LIKAKPSRRKSGIPLFTSRVLHPHVIKFIILWLLKFPQTLLIFLDLFKRHGKELFLYPYPYILLLFLKVVNHYLGLVFKHLHCLVIALNPSYLVSKLIYLFLCLLSNNVEDVVCNFPKLIIENSAADLQPLSQVYCPRRVTIVIFLIFIEILHLLIECFICELVKISRRLLLVEEALTLLLLHRSPLRIEFFQSI